MSNRLLIVMRALVSLGVLLPAVPANAQIYSWRNTEGTPVFSDRRPADRLSTPIERTGETARARPATPFPSEPFEELVARHATAQGVGAELVNAVIRTESGFNPRARSPKGALGLMQLMPATAAELGVVEPFDPAENIRGGVTYLRQLLTRYDNDVELALAAYNAGPAAVDRYGARVPPYPETRRYVASIQNQLRQTPVRRSSIFKSVEEVGGRPIPRYSNVPPSQSRYNVIGR